MVRYRNRPSRCVTVVYRNHIFLGADIDVSECWDWGAALDIWATQHHQKCTVRYGTVPGTSEKTRFTLNYCILNLSFFATLGLTGK